MYYSKHSMGNFTSIWDSYQILLGYMLPFLFYVSPIIVGIVIWHLRLYYLRYNYIKNIDWVLLEIRMPQEISKSPVGMEVIFSTMHQTSDGHIIDKFIKGKLRPWFSLEICSFGGTIHFYIRTDRKFRNLLESTVYAQYPEVEIHEAEDYVHNVPFGLPGSTWDMWGAKLSLDKPDPYPIKTYIDYGLDKEEKDPVRSVDPLTPIIEFMGSIKPSEQVWMQIVIMAARKKWKEEGEQIVNDIMKRDPKTKSSREKTETGFPIIPSLSEGEREVIKALERAVAKLGFETGIRTLYFAEPEIDKNNIAAILGTIKQFNSQNLNGFKRAEDTSFDYPWQDFFGIRLARLKTRYFDAYRRRSYFFMPYIDPAFILNTEELATIFHFPGGVSKTPTFERIMSKRAEPPSNLPV